MPRGAWRSRRPLGHAAGSLLIGNFGDGRINIVARQSHHGLLGALRP
jgi:hypothetical protein